MNEQISPTAQILMFTPLRPADAGYRQLELFPYFKAHAGECSAQQEGETPPDTQQQTIQRPAAMARQSLR